METLYCPKCQKDKPKDNFYKRPERPTGYYGYCKLCFNIENDKRRLALKEKAIIYKGSKCVRCGLAFPETPQFIFDFHHRNKEEKGDWSSIRKKKWALLKLEIDKCDLLCANCHRYVEYGGPTGI